MYPIHPKLAMDIAISSGIASRRQEWPDDPNGAPVRRAEPVIQDHTYMALRSIRNSLGQRLTKLFARTEKEAASSSKGVGLVVPINERPVNADCVKAA